MKTALKKGLKPLSLFLTEHRQGQMLELLEALKKWNKTYNLTAITSLKEMVSYHLLDSLSLVPYLRGERIVDVGTGAGFPGLPLAIACPDKHFTLIEPIDKRVQFLIYIKYLLRLDNVTIVKSTAEAVTPEQPFETILSRAVATVEKILSMTQHFAGPGTRWALQKSADFEDESLQSLSSFTQKDVVVLAIPGIIQPRKIVLLQED